MRQTTLSLIIFSFMLGFIVPACGFMWGGKYSVIEICTDQGIEQRLVSDDTNPTQPTHDQSSKKCDFCFKTTHLNSYIIPPSHTYLALYNTQITVLVNHQNFIALSLDHKLFARGPPHLS